MACLIVRMYTFPLTPFSRMGCAVTGGAAFCLQPSGCFVGMLRLSLLSRMANFKPLWLFMLALQCYFFLVTFFFTAADEVSAETCIEIRSKTFDSGKNKA